MRVLSLGLDNSILDNNSALAKRVIEYGNLVEEYTVLAPSMKKEEVKLSEKVKVYGSGGGNKLARFFKIYNLAKNLLRQEKYDIITVQDQYYLALAGACLAKKFKVGLEIQIHGFEKFYGLRKLIAKYVLPRANAIRAVSQRLERQLVGRFKVAESKITVAPIYSERATHNAQRITQDKNKFIFLTAGRLVPVKNIGLQIQAMAEAVKKYPETELWIIGDGRERAGLEKLSYALRATRRVKFLGWKNNLEEYYNTADAFVLTSNYEGWGLAVIEAAQFGLPIIMTDVGCAGEVIEDGKSGLVIPIGNKQKLVEAMLKIITDENLRKKLGENAGLALSRLPNEEQTLALYKKSWEMAASNKI